MTSTHPHEGSPAVRADPAQVTLPLAHNDEGPAVRDLQHRLIAYGIDLDPGEHGRFGEATFHAMTVFQMNRGLVATGVCDRHTWAALVEAGFRLGDRLIYLRRPMQRGDDVSELQARLGGLGFDAGRVDGIFGPDTETALREFQLNAGLTVDGVCGPDVTAALERLSSSRTSGTAVAGVRERERLRVAPRELQQRRIVLGEPGGLDVLANAVARHLIDDGARVAVLQHPDASTQARQANEFEAELYLGLSLGEPPCWTSYYASNGFESLGGHRLADLVHQRLTSLDLDDRGPVGMRMPALRETRMPAVVVHLGPPAAVVLHTADLAEHLADAVREWVRTPLDS